MTASETVSIMVLIIYVVSLAVGAIMTGLRIILYRVGRVQRPRLLTRDLLFMGGHALTFTLVSIARVSPELRAIVNPPEHGPALWWLVLTATPAIVGVLAYVYYEIFVIAPMYTIESNGLDDDDEIAP